MNQKQDSRLDFPHIPLVRCICDFLQAATMTHSTRLLQSDDFDAWRPLWQQYLDFYQTDLDEAITLHTWHRIIHPEQADMIGLGVFVDGKLSGFTHLVFHPNTWSAEPCCYLEDLCVDAQVRGQGLGRALINAAQDLAQQKQCCRLYWVTTRDNHTAQQLYNTLAEQTDFIQYKIGL